MVWILISLVFSVACYMAAFGPIVGLIIALWMLFSE